MSGIRAVLERHRKDLMALDGVVGVAVGRSGGDSPAPCIFVYVTTDEAPPGVPGTLDGYDVEIRKTTGFKAT